MVYSNFNKNKVDLDNKIVLSKIRFKVSNDFYKKVDWYLGLELFDKEVILKEFKSEEAGSTNRKYHITKEYIMLEEV